MEKAGPNLKVISTMSVGVDHIDLEEAKKRNVRVGYTPYILSDATAELTVALLLATSRRLFEASCEITNGEWKSWAPQWLCGPGLCNKTIGIVGLGRIGMDVARRLKPFKVRQFLYWGRTEKPYAKEVCAKKVPFDELLSKSDFVIITCALTPDTHHLFNEQAFCKMKKGAILINTSRGTVIKQNDLINALECGMIAAAGLDVTDPEPLPLDSKLLTMGNVVVLPHIGSATIETRADMSILAARNLIEGVSGTEMPEEYKI